MSTVFAIVGWYAYFANFANFETTKCNAPITVDVQINAVLLVALPWLIILLLQVLNLAARKPLVPRVLDIITVLVALIWSALLVFMHESQVFTCSHTDWSDAVTVHELASYLVIAPLAFVLFVTAGLKLLNGSGRT